MKPKQNDYISFPTISRISEADLQAFRNVQEEESLMKYERSYQNAVDLMENAHGRKDYEVARDLFKALNGYKDSNERAGKCQDVINHMPSPKKIMSARNMRILLASACCLVIGGICGVSLMNKPNQKTLIVPTENESHDEIKEESATTPKDVAESSAMQETASEIAVNDEVTIEHSGISGSLDWEIDSDGVLTIRGYGDYSDALDGPEWLEYSDAIKKAVVQVKGITNTSQMFKNCSSLTEVDTSGLDTSQVTDMSSMFYYCPALTEIDVSGFDTSQVTNMSYMFWYCPALMELDVSGFDTSRVTNMGSMFGACTSLTKLDVIGFDTSQVRDMSGMFHKCSSLTELDVRGFYTWQVTDMSSMFKDCSSLTFLDVRGFYTWQVTDISSMFDGCSSLTELDVSRFDTYLVTDMSAMFGGCSSLTELDVSGFDTSQVTDMSSMFSDCSSLTELDVSGFNTSRVTDMHSMFDGCSSLTFLEVGGWDTSQLKDIDCIMSKCVRLSTVLTISSGFLKEGDWGCFYRAATSPDAKIIVRYNGLCTKEVAQSIVDSAYSDSHVYLQE